MNETELLSKLVSIPSVFPNESALGEFLEAHLQSIGFSTRRQEVSEGRFNILAERGSEGKPILFYGHMDTVPKYGEWDSDPFTLRKDGDRLYGLGAYDMKAGLSAILSACSSPTDMKIKIAFAVDEENNSEGGWAIVNSGFANDAMCIIVPEINDSSQPPEIANSIMLGRRGRAVYEYSVPGKTSHGAQPGTGVSAIREACRLIPLLDSAQDSPEPGKLPPATQFVRKVSSESTSLSLPETATVELDRHLVFPETPESVLASLRSQLDSMYSSGQFSEHEGRRISVGLKPRKTPYLPPFLTPEDSAPVSLLSSIVKERMGSAQFSYGATVCDENAFASSGIPIMDFGPVGANCHSANEWVSEKSLQDISLIFSEFINRA
jgi:succinyl-diaminopimelate desuccinylase